MHKLFLDVDGVFADYSGEYTRLTGGDPSEKGKQKAIRFKQFPHFYRNLPLLPDAMHLWNAVKHYNPTFLTAASNYLKSSRDDKFFWLHQKFGVGADRVIVVAYPNEKYKHCTPGAILVDDNQKNCWEWQHAGGVAIRHVSANDTIHKLQALYGHASHVTETFETIAQTPTVLETFDALSCPNVVEVHNTLELLD